MARRRFDIVESGGGGHDGGGMMRWLLTYADMITLLTAFFIMMYSMSVLNLEKFKAVAISVRSGFGGQVGGAGILDKGGVVYAQEHQGETPDPGPTLEAIMRYLSNYVRRHNLGDVVKIRITSRGLIISLTADGLLFERGQADLTPGARVVLDEVAVLLAKVKNDILVEGHTCDLPIATSAFPSNWELSTARATAVVRYLVERHHIAPDRIGAAGYADTRPFLPNTCEANRRRNRRVDVVILSGLASVVHNAQIAPAVPPPYAGKKGTSAVEDGATPTAGRQGADSAQRQAGGTQDGTLGEAAGKSLVSRGGPSGTLPPPAEQAGKLLKDGVGVKAIATVRRIPKPEGAR